MAVLSGQTLVTTPGTEVKLATYNISSSVLVKALTTNTGLVYIGNVNGTVSAATGLPLAAGDSVVFFNASDLESILVDAAVGGEGVAWAVLEI